MVEITPEEDLKLCRRVMKEEFADLNLLESTQLGNLLKRQV